MNIGEAFLILFSVTASTWRSPDVKETHWNVAENWNVAEDNFVSKNQQ